MRDADTVVSGSAGPVDSEELLRRLEMVTDARLSSLDVEDLLRELLERTMDALGVAGVTVLLMDESDQYLVPTAAVGVDQPMVASARVPIGTGLAGQVAQTATATVVGADRDARGSVPSADEGRPPSTAGVPIMSGERVIGVLTISSAPSRPFTEGDIGLLMTVADRAALALRARTSRLERFATLALQRSLVPGRPPTIPGFDISARYLPGADVGVGGDWYDVFTLPSGHVGVVIGDVAGHGLQAAVIMGRIRSALRAYALETTDPADVLSRLDRKIQLFELGATATALYAVVDPSRTSVTMSSAGHPPPLLLSETGPARIVALAPDLLLGALPDTRRRCVTVDLPVGSGLFYYTDGLVETRGVSILDRIRELADALAGPSLEDVCGQAVQQLLSGPSPTDDVAVIAIRRTT